jgi:hypothetical protein
MARPVYSTSFICTSLATSGVADGPLPEAGFVYIVRDIQVRTDESAAGNLLSFVMFEPPFPGPPTVTLIQWNVPGPSVSDRHWEGRIVVPEGFSFFFLASTGSWDVSCCGYDLTVP